MYIDHKGTLIQVERRRWPLTIVVWVVILATYFFYVPGNVSSLKFPGPEQLFSAQQQISSSLLTHILATFRRLSVGFLLGSTIGATVGFAMFAVRWIEAILFSIIEVIRPIPPVALIPFFILWFRLHESGQVVLIGLGCFMVLVVSTHEALSQVNVALRRAAQSLGATGTSYYLQVLLPAILPQLIAPLRVSLALAIALAVTAEFMGAQSGLGFLMMVARRTLHTETILLCVIILGSMSAILDFCLRRCLRYLTRWSG